MRGAVSSKELRDPAAVERRRHHEEAQIRPQMGAGIESQSEAEIGVERALMKFIEENRGNAFEPRIIEDHAGEDALRHDLDAGLGRDARHEPHAQSDRLAEAFAEHIGHTFGRGAGGEPPRFEEHDFALGRPWLIDKREGDARGLAGAGRRRQNRPCAGRERGTDLRQDGIDRQLGYGAMHAAQMAVHAPRGKGASPVGQRACGASTAGRSLGSLGIGPCGKGSGRQRRGKAPLFLARRKRYMRAALTKIKEGDAQVSDPSVRRSAGQVESGLCAG